MAYCVAEQIVSQVFLSHAINQMEIAMLTTYSRALKLGVSSLVLATAVAAQSVTIETAQGAVSFDAIPQSVAVFDVSAVDTLDALGIMPSGTISNLYVGYLDDVSAQAEVIGSLFEPDFEAVNALAPDVVIVGGRSASQLEPMSQIATTIDMTIWGDDIIAQVEASLAAYGALFGKEAKAAEIAADFTAAKNAAIAAAEGQGSALIVMTNGPTISAYGAGSRFGWLHTALGIPEAVEGVDEAVHGEAISYEFIHEANPDWLIVIDRVAAIGAEGESAQQTLDNELVADTNAWKNGNVIYLNSANIYIAGGGVQSIQSVFEAITAAFGDAS